MLDDSELVQKRLHIPASRSKYITRITEVFIWADVLYKFCKETEAYF